MATCIAGSRSAIRFAAMASICIAIAGCSRPPELIGWTLPEGVRPDLCNDYGSYRNCVGGNYIPGRWHQGLDFGGSSGTPVISATYGEIVAASPDACAGFLITVKTPIRLNTGETLYAMYAHAKPVDDTRPSRAIKPGDVIGHIIPLLGTVCYMSRTHVHLELRIENDRSRTTNPHQYWADGVGKVTCFRAGATVPQDRIVAPIRCDN